MTSPPTAMKSNSRSTRQKAAAAIAMLLVLAGVAIAAVSATGADRPKGAERARHSAAGIRYRDLPIAANGNDARLVVRQQIGGRDAQPGGPDPINRRGRATPLNVA